MEKKISYRGSTHKYNLLEKYDMSQFDAHRIDVEPGETNNPADIKYILRFWDINKSKYLYKLLGNQLIVSKPVSFTKNTDEIYGDVANLTNKYRDFMRAVYHGLCNALNVNDYDYNSENGNVESSFVHVIRYSISTDGIFSERISINPYIKTTYGNSLTVFINGNRITISEGQKVMKALGNICRAIGMSDEYEEFRIAHSMIYNQKNVRGNLCLSIHPLDYATASDNNNNWNSCMSWFDKGCYRLGTIEMMNSPMVICAYLTGNNEMDDVGGDKWNSKKWRTWIMIDETAVFVNKQYPYENTELADIAANWVCDLAKENLGWSFGKPYKQNIHDFSIAYTTNFMYNDTVCFDDTIVAVSNKYNEFISKEVNYSGPANCMWCGEEIEPGDIEADTLICAKCQGSISCVSCGDVLDEDYVYWGPDDSPYCSYCYEDLFRNCSCCDESVLKDELTKITLPSNHSLYHNLILDYDHIGYIQQFFCDDCLKALGLSKNNTLISDDLYSNNSGEDSHLILNPENPNNREIYIKLNSCDIDNPDEDERKRYGAIWDEYVKFMRAKSF